MSSAILATTTTTTTTTPHLPLDSEFNSNGHRSTPLLSKIEPDTAQQPMATPISTTTSNANTTPSSTTATGGGWLLRMLHSWWTECAWPGLGLFGESYLLFSIGTLKPIWQQLYPDCFYDGITCSSRLLHSLTYSVVLGVMTGMLILGCVSNTIGRRRGSCITAALMCVGAVGLTTVSFVYHDEPQLLFQSMSILWFIFGIGVGGEYPLSASSASERAMEELQNRRQSEEGEESRRQRRRQPLQRPETDNEINYNNQTVAGVNTNSDYNGVNYQNDHRGQRIQLVFAMQGCGIFVNTVIVTLLLLLTGQSGETYDDAALLMVWRITYALGAAILCYVLVSRYLYLDESHVWEKDQQDRKLEAEQQLVLQQQYQQQQSQDQQLQSIQHHVPTVEAVTPTPSDHRPVEITTSVSSLSGASAVNLDISREDTNRGMAYMQMMPSDSTTEYQTKETLSPLVLLFQHYGHRLLGTSLSWLLWDVAFYGNKLFQSSFILALTGGAANTTLLQFCLAAALNAFVALLGYFGAALLVDRVGRLPLQQWGFFITGSLFVACAFLHNRLLTSSSNTTWLIVLYLGSSFFGQLGPNATTFLLPAEVFPTQVRTACHGVSAASGKVGALIAAILFNYLGEVELFLLSGYASVVACLVTYYTLPETNGLDLYELDRKWHLTLAGRQGEYIGPANLPQYQSYYERAKAAQDEERDDYYPE